MQDSCSQITVDQSAEKMLGANSYRRIRTHPLRSLASWTSSGAHMAVYFVLSLILGRVPGIITAYRGALTGSLHIVDRTRPSESQFVGDMASNGNGAGDPSRPIAPITTSTGTGVQATSSTSTPQRSGSMPQGGLRLGQQPTTTMHAGVVQLVHLTPQVKRLQPQLASVMARVQDIERDFDQREEQLEQRKLEMEHEHQVAKEKLLQWREYERGKLDDDCRKLELDEVAFTERTKFARERLKEDVQDFEHRRSEGNAIAHRQEPVTVEVGGEKFRTELSTLTKCKDSLFPDLVKALERRQESERDGRSKRDPHIFIDRDSKHFRFILNYLRQGEQVLRGAALKKADKEDLQDVLFEVQYYRLTNLERLVRRRMVALKKPKDFKQLEEDHCFRKYAVATSQRSPQAIHDAKQYKYITVKEVYLKAENLRGIIFDRVIFEHNVSFEGCLLIEAKFMECSFRSAINLKEADLFRAKFDHCDGIDFEGRFYMDKANTNEVQFVPPLADDS